MESTADRTDAMPNGAALAAFLGAGIGAFAMGFVIILNELGIFTPPTLYAPSGGVTGRTTLAALLWLIAWAVLHHRWKGRHVAPGRVVGWTMALIALGLVLSFPPVWGMVG